jgi:endonuclease/exonuclease/phosphatase family metal-dependent hydrolase
LKLLKNIPRWSNLLLILVTLLAYAAPFANPEKLWHLTFLGLAYPFLLFGNLFFAIFWGLRRSKYALFSIGCIIAGLGYLGSFFSLNLAGGIPKSSKNFTVLTYNIASLSGYGWSDKETDKKLKAEFLAFSGSIDMPDVFCVQEGKGERFMELVRQTFNYQHIHKSKNTIIFSKYPFEKKGEVPFENTTNSCAWADLKTPNGTMRVYDVHLQSNKLGQTADRIATKGDLRERGTWRDIRFVLGRYRNAVRIRANQAQAVARHMAKSPHPVILLGDLNDPPVSYVYRLLSKNKQDSFCEKGFGIGSTFAGNLPFLRIDYVLPDAHFKVLRHRVLDSKLSDHYPVQVTLRWAK